MLESDLHHINVNVVVFTELVNFHAAAYAGSNLAAHLFVLIQVMDEQE